MPDPNQELKDVIRGIVDGLLCITLIPVMSALVIMVYLIGGAIACGIFYGALWCIWHYMVCPVWGLLRLL